MASSSDTVSLRITLRYRDLDEFVKRYAENVSSAGLFLRTRAPKAAGTKIRFELLLADGTRALRGEGVVVTVRSEDKPGMALRFNVLDDESRRVVERIAAEHGEGALAPTPLSTSFGPKPAGREAPPRAGSTAGWRPMKAGRTGWVQMGTANAPAPRRASAGRAGILPRRPSRSLSGPPAATTPPAAAEPPTERARRSALPRQRSEIPRPWAKADADDRTERLDLGRLGKAAEPTVSDPEAPPPPRSLEDLPDLRPSPESDDALAAVPATTAEAVPQAPFTAEAPDEAEDHAPVARADEAPAEDPADAPSLDAWASAIPSGLGPESEELTAIDPTRPDPSDAPPLGALPPEASDATDEDAPATDDQPGDDPSAVEATASDEVEATPEVEERAQETPSDEDEAPSTDDHAPAMDDAPAPAEAAAKTDDHALAPTDEAARAPAPTIAEAPASSSNAPAGEGAAADDDAPAPTVAEPTALDVPVLASSDDEVTEARSPDEATPEPPRAAPVAEADAVERAPVAPPTPDGADTLLDPPDDESGPPARDLGAAEASDFAGLDPAEEDAPDDDPEPMVDGAPDEAAEAEVARVLAEDAAHEAATTALPPRAPVPRVLSNSWSEAVEAAATMTDELAAQDPSAPPAHDAHEGEDPDPDALAAAVVDTASAIAQAPPDSEPPEDGGPPAEDFGAALDAMIGAASADILPPSPTMIEGPSEDVGPETQLLDSPDLPAPPPETEDPPEDEEDPLADAYGAPRLGSTETPWPDVNEALRSTQYRSPTQTGTATEVPAVPAPREDSVAEKLAVAAAAAHAEASAHRRDDAGEPAAASADVAPEDEVGLEAPGPEPDGPFDEATTRAAEPEEPEESDATAAAFFDEPPTRAAEPEEPDPEEGAAAAAPFDEATTRAAEPEEPEAPAREGGALAATPAEPFDEAPTRAAEPDQPVETAEPAREDEALAAIPAKPFDEAPTRALEPEEPAPRAFEDARTAPAIGEGEAPPRDVTVRVPPPSAEVPAPIPPPAGLDAATEIVSAAEAPEPDRSGRAMYSTKVTVTPVTPSERAPASSPPSEPLVRPQGREDRQALLQRAREAAFSEEQTEVPPERDQITHHVRPRAPARERRAERPTGSTDLLGRPTPTRENRVIGIDLGRHWVRIALLERGELELIGAAGSPYLPAVVAVRPDGALVAGVKAQAILHSQPERAVRPLEVLAAWADGDIPAAAAYVPVWKNGEPQVRLGNRDFAFGDVLGALLALVREAAVGHLGTEAFRACVSVPAQLDPDARRALEQSCEAQGLQVGRFVPEPEALLQAYNLEEHPVEVALLVDVGMSHLGLAVARRTKAGFDVVDAETDPNLSAAALDARVADLTLEELRDKAGEDHTADSGAHARLARAVEQARPDIHRSANLELRVQLGAPGGAAGVAVDRLIKLPRSRVYQATEPMVMDICQRARDLLQRSDVDPRAVDAIVVSGSAGHFPPLVQGLHALTQVEPLSVYPGPQVVVMGLARAGQALERAASASRADALHASVGIELPGGRFGPLMRAGAQLPTRIDRQIPTTRDNQTELELRIFQGDAEYTRSCAGLGRLVLSDIPKGLRGEVRIDMSLEVARDGVLTVTLTEPTTRASERLVAATEQTPEERRQQIQRAPAVRSRAGRPPPKDKGFFGRLFGRK